MSKGKIILNKSDNYWQLEPHLFTLSYRRSLNPIRIVTRTFLERRNVRAIDYLQLSQGETVADIGCGSGELIEPLSRYAYKIYAMDYSEAMLNMARNNTRSKNIEFLHTDCNPIPLPDAIVDAGLCLGVLDYVAKPVNFLKEVARITRQNGRIIFTIPKTPSFFMPLRWSGRLRRKIFIQPTLLNCLNRRQLLDLTDESGLSILDISTLWTTMWMVLCSIRK